MKEVAIGSMGVGCRGGMRAVFTVVLLVLGLAGIVALLSIDGAESSGVEVGQVAPDYSAPNLRGEAVSVRQHRGQVVMINIWATWCGPCRVEMPSIQAIYDRYRDRGFTVLAVSIDQGPGRQEKVEEFVERHGLGFPILLDPESRVTRLYQTAGVPETFVLDREGRIVKRVIGASDWNSESNRALIEELLRL